MFVPSKAGGQYDFSKNGSTRLFRFQESVNQGRFVRHKMPLDIDSPNRGGDEKKKLGRLRPDSRT
ncbi:MAG: hypothetical protein DWI21_05875 [Planctomycetota bacterium]|nr:MAG: hypothetical protein DWI21_05875 [Planctomycetota bacterium]